jgi:hypothetical protein
MRVFGIWCCNFEICRGRARHRVISQSQGEVGGGGETRVIFDVLHCTMRDVSQKHSASLNFSKH